MRSGKQVGRWIRGLASAVSLAYAGGILSWLVLRTWLGDRVWWLALLNTFVPFLFLPLAVLGPVAALFRWRWVRIGAALPALVFLGLYGSFFCPAWPAPAGAGEIPLTVMTFNIWGESRGQETAQAIVAQGTPDVVAIQELGPEMEVVLREQIGELYPYSALRGARAHRGMGVLSRYPLVELDAERLRDPAWEVQVVRIETAHGPLILYNIHPLSTNVLVYIEEGKGIATRTEASFAARQALIDRLVEDIAGQLYPVIVAGDLNVTDQSAAYRLLARHLVDVHRAAGWGFGHTFPAYGGRFRGVPIPPRLMRIDILWVSAELIPLHCQVGREYGESDHLPVWAELGWKR